jgi:hypothetical protein
VKNIDGPNAGDLASHISQRSLKERPWQKNPWAVGLALGVLALLIRLWHLREMEANDPFFYYLILDPAFYHDWAIRISEGNFDRDSVFFLSPLYPYFLGFIYWLTGPGMIIPRVVQVVFGAFSVVGIFFIGRRVLGPATGLLAAVIYTFYAPAIFYEPLYLVTAIQTPLNIALVWALLGGFAKPEQRLVWLGCGALLGLSALARPNVLLFGGFVVAGLLLQINSRPEWRQAIVRSLIFAIGVGIIVFPVTLRNYLVAGDIMLVTSSGGPNFYIGNNVGATGRFQTPPIFNKSEVNSPRSQMGAYIQLAESETGHPLSPSEVSDFWYRKTWSEIADDPGRWFRLLLLKLSLFFNYYEFGSSRNLEYSAQYSNVLRLPLFRFGLIAPFAITGMFVASRRWRGALMIYGMVAVYIVTVLMFFFLSHYRMPATPFLAIFAAYCCVWMLDAVRNGRWFKSALATSALLVSALWVHLTLTNPNFEIENIHFNLGNIYAEQERYDDAIREFRASIDLNPNVISRYHNLAYIYGLRPGTYRESIETWEKVLAIGIERNDNYHVRAAKQEIARLRKELGDSQ